MKIKTENFGENIITIFEEAKKTLSGVSTPLIMEKRESAFKHFNENPVIPHFRT